MGVESQNSYLSTSRLQIVPRSMRLWAIRFAYEALGIFLFAVAIFLTLSFLSYNPLDPSLNTSTASSPTNWFGAPGANVSDAFVQTFGLAAYALPLPLMFIALSLMFRQYWRATRLQTILQFSAWPVFLLTACLFLSGSAKAAPWDLAVGAGGLIGDILAHLVTAAFAAINLYAPATMTSVLGFILALISGALACGIAGLQPARFARQLRAFYARSVDLSAQLANNGQAVLDFICALWPGGAGREEAEPPIVGHPPRDPDAEAIGGTARHSEDDSDWAVPIIRTQKSRRTSRRELREAQPMLDLEPNQGYQLPPLSLLAKPKRHHDSTDIPDDSLEQNARLLEKVLEDFGIRGEIIGVRPGPVVTLYELEPAAGIKSSRVIGLADDIARSMSAIAARVAVIPGRNVIGIELPNSVRETVLLREVLASPEYEKASSRLTIALGKDISGDPVMGDLASMPHLLVAGTTGSGKSVGINAMILSLLFRLTPSQCKLILIDPKMLELSVYDGIPHLMTPVVTDPKKAVVALKWIVKEMEDRYRKMSKLGVRNITGYNQRITEAWETGETLYRTVQTGFDKETGEPVYEDEELPLEPMPFIVVVVDEMADLMMVAGKDIEAAVQRLAQMARAAGIHLITATQRPSVDVITGTIKANFPTRISFQVTSKIDSRTILGEQGGEQLLGQGDMLYMAGGGRIRRLHGPFVSDHEVEKVVKFLKKQASPDYIEDVTESFDSEEADMLLGLASAETGGDGLYDQAVAVVLRDGKASTSYVQRRLQIGYNRAARIIERMEDEGVISQPNHSGKREVLLGDHAVK